MLRSLRCCLNPKVIGGLIAVGVAVWLIGPAAGTAALPLLVTLVCPLSMGIMAWQMRRGGSCAVPGADGSAPPAASGAVFGGGDGAGEELAIQRARQRLDERKDQPSA